MQIFTILCPFFIMPYELPYIVSIYQAGDCTLREAVIIGSILAKNSIPMLHSAAAILKIAEMDYNGANSIFLRALLDKKYALPYRVIDAVVFHFLGLVFFVTRALKRSV